MLLRALKHADGELKREILFMLGTFAINRLAADAAQVAMQRFPLEIEALLDDRNMKVKKAALKILAQRKQR